MLKSLSLQTIILLIFSLSLSYSQSFSPSFPDTWVGKWKGALYIDQAGRGTVQQLNMELHVQALDPDSTWQWKIIYQTDSSIDERDYRLKLVNAEQGHYAIDEQNGIILDAFWFDPVFSSRFDVGGQILLITYSQQENKLAFEVHAGSSEAIQKSTWTDSTRNPPLLIESLPIQVRQHAILNFYE